MEGVVVSLVAIMNIRQEVLPTIYGYVVLIKPLQPFHDSPHERLKVVDSELKQV